jgi:protein-glutamine gamma-glutamyltransferase
VSDADAASAWQRQPPAAADLELPRGQNPRLEALATDWMQQAPATGPRAAAARLAAAERWFRRQPFRYTLQPGTLPPRAPLDAFLFERREGFCGHFASAFTALMRAAGVPARVVSGYQGGAWVQPLGGTGYLELRQADAHAWSEVWLAGEGWRRVDPTTWVPAGAEARGRERLAAGPLLWLQRQWWGLDLAWSRLWLGFDRQGQAELLRRLLGERQAWAGALALSGTALALAVGVAVLAWLRRHGSPTAADPWRRELDRALKSFAARGMAPQAGETLPAFAARLERRWPALANELGSFVGLYQWQRFTAPAALGNGNGEGAGAGAPSRPREQAWQLMLRRRRLEDRLRQLDAAERRGRPWRGTKEGPLG